MKLDLDKPYGVQGVTAREILRELGGFARQHLGKWARPLDVGGSNGSPHSAILTRLVRAGLVERKKRSWAFLRGSWSYRLVEQESAENG